jgi:hypothetical protein
VAPFSSDRRGSIDRSYIGQFIAAHAGDVHGRVLVDRDDEYPRQYGGDRMTHVDVIDSNPMNRHATIVDFRKATSLATGSYDCFIMTGTLHTIYDLRAVLKESVRVLATGGVLLAALPSARRLASAPGTEGDFWRFTASAARRLFAEFFPADGLDVRSYGNVLAEIAYVYGVEPDELSQVERETHDPYFPLVVGVRAQK